jgi:alpha-galactosidase/6-phospho-beta-glucosidase family protein
MQIGSVNIERQDIVGLVHYAWMKSFARKDANKKARVLAEMQKKKDKEESAQLKRQDAEAALHNKVVAIRQKNKQPEQ